MNRAILLLLIVFISSATKYPTVYDHLYVSVGETFRKPLTEFFSTNEKWHFELYQQQLEEINIFNDDFEYRQQTQFTSSNTYYIQGINEVISAKPYIIDEYYHIGNLFGFLSKNVNDNYVFVFNSVASADPVFDKSIDLSEVTEGIVCLDFDFYNQNKVVVVCVEPEQVIKNFHFLTVNLQTDVLEVTKFAPQQIYNVITNLKVVIQYDKQKESKALYLGVPSFDVHSKSYSTPSIIEQYTIFDNNDINFDKVIDGISVSKNYQRKAGLALVDFMIIGNELLVVDKDPQGDVAYIYIVNEENQTLNLEAQQIQLKSSTRAQIDTSYVYLHKKEELTLSKQYYLSIVFSDESQTLTDCQDLLTSYSQIKYQDKGNNIIAKITQNYKVILNLETKTLIVQNLFKNTYEKLLKLDGQPLGLLTKQSTDSIIILFNTYTKQYQIQEPYIQIQPQVDRQLKEYVIAALQEEPQTIFVSIQFQYQALAHLDQSLYLKHPQAIERIDAKPINGKACSISPIMAVGPCVELDYEIDAEIKLTALKSKTLFITTEQLEKFNGENMHIAKRIKSEVAIIYRTIEFNQHLLSCTMDVDYARCWTIEVYIQDQMAEYQFSQSSERYDFGFKNTNNIEVYRQGQFSFTLTTLSPINNFIMISHLIIIQDSNSIVFYPAYQNDHTTPLYTIDEQLLIKIGYQKQFNPQKFFMNYDISNLLIIQNNNNDLIVGRYDSIFQIITILYINSDTNVFISISEDGFYVLEQKSGYQSLKYYSLVSNQIQLMNDNPLQGYKLLNDQAFDPITSIFVISASKDNKNCILIFDPKLQPRDVMYRVIFLDDNIQMKNLQITSQGDVLSITGFVNKELKQYSTIRQGFFVEGNQSQSSTFSKLRKLDIQYSNSDSIVQTKQFVNLINDFNLIYGKSIDYLPQNVDVKGESVIKMPKDLLTGNIAQYELSCEQCWSGNIYLQPPLFKTSKQYQIGKQKQCLNLELGLLLCIDRDIQLFKENKLVHSYSLFGQGVYLYQVYGDTYIATHTQGSVIFQIKDERIVYQSTNEYLTEQNQQIIDLQNRFIMALHQSNYFNPDGYEILEFVLELGVYVLKSRQVKPIENIQSIAYDPLSNAIMYVRADQYLYFQKISIQNQELTFKEQFQIDLKILMEKQSVYLANAEFIFIQQDNTQSYKFFLFDSEGNGFKVHIQEQNVQTVSFQLNNIYASARREGQKVNSIQINEQFVVINRQFYDGIYIMVYKYDQPNNAPNYYPTYMIGEQRVESKLNILTQQDGYSTLAIQVDEDKLTFYYLTESISVVVRDGSAFKSQTLSIMGSNFYGTQLSTLYLQRVITNDPSPKSYLWIYITFSVLFVGCIISYVMYKRYQKNQNVGLLESSLE